MRKVCNINIENSEKVYKNLRRFIEKLKRLYLISDIYVYGSFASGEIHEGSDIDLLIVGDFEGRMFDRIGKILELTDLPIEPLVYTPSEFRRLKRESSFIKWVLKKAKRL